MEYDRKIAVLIDADNVSQKYLKYIFDEIANHGTPTYKRIYGDWTRPNMDSWKKVLLNYSLIPIQQYSYTTGKNSTDSALIIDAMDILYSQNVNGFCIVSSDSDFTRLASRLRETGMYVLGMGEKKTPQAFISACEKFKYLEVISSATAENGKTKKPPVKDEEEAHPEKAGMANVKEIAKAIRTIINDISDEDGWVHLGAVGSVLGKRYPDFDVRNYGFSKLTPFVVSLGQFEIQDRPSGKANSSHKYIRNKS